MVNHLPSDTLGWVGIDVTPILRVLCTATQIAVLRATVARFLAPVNVLGTIVLASHFRKKHRVLQPPHVCSEFLVHSFSWLNADGKRQPHPAHSGERGAVGVATTGGDRENAAVEPRSFCTCKQ